MTKNTPWPVINDDNIENNQPSGKRIKVRCTHPQGIYYNFRRRREGDVFELVPQIVTVLHKDGPQKGLPVMENGLPVKAILSAEDQFSPNTMEKVEEDEPLHTTNAQESLDKETNRIRRGKKENE